MLGFVFLVFIDFCLIFALCLTCRLHGQHGRPGLVPHAYSFNGVEVTNGRGRQHYHYLIIEGGIPQAIPLVGFRQFHSVETPLAVRDSNRDCEEKINQIQHVGCQFPVAAVDLHPVEFLNL